jgi:hypothetical protein
MATSTNPRRTPVPRRTSSAPKSRFARGTSSTSRFSRGTTSTNRSPALRRRRQQQPSGLKKVLGSVIPSGAAKKAAPSGKKGAAGGVAALAAAAAGLAYKNRDKLAQLRGKGGKDTGSDVNRVDSVPGPPTTPAV